MAFDPTKPVRTRAGRPARIICADAAGERPIVALIHDGRSEFLVVTMADGRQASDGERAGDLVNATLKVEGWVNVYRGEGHGYMGNMPPRISGSSPTSKAEANVEAASLVPIGYKRVACIFVSFEEGDGLP